MCRFQSVRENSTAGKDEGGEKQTSGSIGTPQVAMVSSK